MGKVGGARCWLSGWSGGVCGYAARVLILTRFWAKTPCPHQELLEVAPVVTGNLQHAELGRLDTLHQFPGFTVHHYADPMVREDVPWDRPQQPS